MRKTRWNLSEINIFGDGYYFTKAVGNTIYVKPNWIKCSDRMPPKTGKFLFHYWAGIGIGNYGHTYKIINGSSERSNDKYILVLWPSEISAGFTCPYEWEEKDMIEMEVSWMPLPDGPHE